MRTAGNPRSANYRARSPHYSKYTTVLKLDLTPSSHFAISIRFGTMPMNHATITTSHIGDLPLNHTLSDNAESNANTPATNALQ